MRPESIVAILLAIGATLLSLPAYAGCRWDGDAPVCNGRCSDSEIEVTRRGGENVTNPGEPDYGFRCFAGQKALCCARCPVGLVWRQATSQYDVECVTPAERDRAQGKAPALPPRPSNAGTLGLPPCVVGGVPRPDIADADCLEAQTTGCIRHLLSDAAYAACLKATGHRPIKTTGKPKPVGSGCLIGGVNRTDIADADCKEAQTTGCIRHLLSDADYQACLAAQHPGGAPTGGAGVATAVNGTTVYKENNGDSSPQNKLCDMFPGDTGHVIGKGPDKWVNLSNISGQCSGRGPGWVWNEGELQVP